jgi:N utilization substance protein A
MAHRPHLDVIVDNDQLSLAIGKRGLNVRLAAELIGAKIDIKSEEEVKGEVADALSAMLQEAMAESRSQTNVHDIDDLPEEWANKLDAAGYDDLDSVVNATVEDLTAIEGIDDEIAAQIIELAKRHEEVQSGEGGEQEETYQEDAEAEGEEQQASGEASDEKQEEAQVE